MNSKNRILRITDYELLERYASGERDFAGIELIESGCRPSKYGGIDLDGVVLQNINLRGAYFHEVYMIGADLSGADLGGIFMRSCCLNNATIRHCNLRAANLTNTYFLNADLSRSDLDYVNATGSAFRGAYLSSLEYAILADADFQGAHTETRLICRGMNLIWNTIMPDGSIVRGPQWGTGCDAR